MEEYAAIRNYVVDEHILVGKDYHNTLLSEKVGYKIVLRKIQPVRMSVCVCVCVHTHDCIQILTLLLLLLLSHFSRVRLCATP